MQADVPTLVPIDNASPAMRGAPTDRREPAERVRVVLFSGGRGASVLSEQLVAHPSIALTIAINGYDDGASTGEVRRFLGDCLGPSDFRKNAARLARRFRPASPALPELMEWRLPAGCSGADARLALSRVGGAAGPGGAGWIESLATLAGRLDARSRAAVSRRLDTFLGELDRSARPFDFSDCSVGNLVFAGSFLECGRRFNDAVADYCALLELPEGLIENVTDGRNAFLVALDPRGRLVASEEEIVDARRQGGVSEIFLVDHVLDEAERREIDAAGPERAAARLARHEPPVGANPRLLERLRRADFVIYAPGTQHSSLFPSYLTPGVSEAIAGNHRAIKLLITNIQPDAEIVGQSAVDLIERALYYLNGKGVRSVPMPALITHALLNDPRADAHAPYVPLGRLERVEDPRLVRIANYEDGESGRHDAAKVLIPFIESFLARRTCRVAVLLHDAASPDKIVQTVLEMIRGGIEGVRVDLTVFYSTETPLPAAFAAGLPFPVRRLDAAAVGGFWQIVAEDAFDYVLLFESSGMYKGEDLVSLASSVAFARLDAVWGSRRLSVKDIEESYRLRYRHNAVQGAVSAVGSHLLSACCLALYGRYISDTLSGVRAVRARYFSEHRIDVSDKLANHRLLAAVLRESGEILEVPVQFFPLSPARIKRTSVWDGLRALSTLVGMAVRRRGPQQPAAAVGSAAAVPGSRRPVRRL